MKDKIQMRIAWLLPRWVVKWCLVRSFGHGTTGKWSHTNSPSLTVIDAMKRWEDVS